MFNIDYFVPEYPDRITEDYGNYYTADAPVTLYVTLPGDCLFDVTDTSGRPRTKMLLDFQHNEVPIGTSRISTDYFYAATSASGNPAILRSVMEEQFGTIDLQWLTDRNRLYLEQVSVPADAPEAAGPYFELPYVHRATLTELRTSSLLALDFVFGFATTHANTPMTVAIANTACTNFGASTTTTAAYGNKLTTVMGDGGDTFADDMRFGLRGVTILNPEPAEEQSTVTLDKDIIVLEVSVATWTLYVNDVAVATGAGVSGAEKELSLEWCATENTPSGENAPHFNVPAEVKIYYRVRHRAYGGEWTDAVDTSITTDVDFRGSCKIIAASDLAGGTSGAAYNLLELTQAAPATPCIRMEEFFNYRGAWVRIKNAVAEGGTLIDTSVFNPGGGIG